MMVGVKHFVLPPKLLRFLIGRKHATGHGSKLTNSLAKRQGEHTFDSPGGQFEHRVQIAANMCASCRQGIFFRSLFYF